MKPRKITKVIISIVLILTLFFLLGQGIVNAAKVQERIDLQVSYKRKINGVDKRAYAFNNDHKITQIFSGTGTNTKTNYVCTNASVVWSPGQEIEYDTSYDLATDKTLIQSLVPAYTNVVGNKYAQILWILDNIAVGTDFSVDSILAKAGIVKQAGEDGVYYYDPTVNPNSAFSKNNAQLAHFGSVWQNNGYAYEDANDNTINVILSKDLIEAVEQAALWYFTNNGNAAYDFYTNYTGDEHQTITKWLKYSDDANSWDLLANETKTVGSHTYNTGDMLQEQASILYNYLIDSANAAAAEGYTGAEQGTIAISYAGTGSQKMVREGSNYKIGPLKVTTTNATITGVKATTGTNNTEITGITLQNASGTTITKPSNNTNFYVIVPASQVNGNVKITANATTQTTEKKYRIRATTDNNTAVQGVVEITPKTVPIQVSIVTERQFDLALRKIITKVGNSANIVNENGRDAKRTINIDHTTIPNTATYKHRKDPIVVKEGDTVTYQISIYNEGEIDGYALSICDQLPTGLIPADLTSTATGAYEPISVTSTKGNRYLGVYDSTRNNITFTLVSGSTPVSIPAYDGTKVESDTIEVTCKVTQKAATDGSTKHYLTNIAYIGAQRDKDGNDINPDRDSTANLSVDKTANDLNSTNPDSYKGKTTNQSVKNDTTNGYYYEGIEDDDDFEKVVVMPKKFDLALRKFITKINSQDITDRVPNITESEITKLINGTATYDNGTTLQKTQPKNKLEVDKGDTIVYTIRVYNEGEVHGYAEEVTDYLPEGLTFKTDSEINRTYKWTANGQKITTNYLSKEEGNESDQIDSKTGVAQNKNIIYAFDKENKTLSYKDLKVECLVNDKATSSNLKNIAEITKNKDYNGNTPTDVDSQPGNVHTKLDEYNPTNPDKGRGEQDDDDFEDLKLAVLDLALRKFISKTSPDGKFSTNNTEIANRAPQVDTSELKAGRETTAIYNHSKEPLAVSIEDYVLYNIRVYNEGSASGYASQITDYLPEYLDFVDSTEASIKSINDHWDYDKTTRKLTTKSSANNAKTLLKAFDKEKDDGKGSGLSYVDVQVVCKVNKKALTNKNITNIAEITEYKDKNEKVIEKDIDSSPKNLPETVLDEKNKPDYNGGEDKDKNDNYVPGQEDDDDFEKVVIKNFDLALRKFITKVADTDITNRVPQLSYDKNGNIVYTHPKDVVKLHVGDTVIYTIRVFNEGDISGYAEEVSDDMPEFLEYLPDNETNKKYGWIMYDKDGKETTKVSDAKKIVTKYLSKAEGEKRKEETLLYGKGLKSSDTEDGKPVRDYKDVLVAFKVKDPGSNKTVIVNKAQISEDADEDGNPVNDIDSIPDKWNDGEDDQDYENVGVNYFDLALLKYVTKAIVTENGKTTTTNTGNNGSSKDITPKVEIHRKKVNTTVVKFEYVIKITNEGDIAGYAKEITDYVPAGLKFYSEDNKGWKDEGNNVISTKLLENTFLQPGQSATVKVILRWINGSGNLGIKTNTAEISEDYNEEGVPDRDSTPDNKKTGEDDIDDAPVLLTISTGGENITSYILGTLGILVVIGIGVMAIKKYVL